MGGLLVGFAITVLIYTVVLAIVLRAAVYVFNLIAGKNSPNGVPEPNFLKAMGIVLIVVLAQTGADYIVRTVTGAAVTAAGNPLGSGIIVTTSSWGVALLTMSVLLMALLPTTFPRAVLVTIAFMIIGILVAAIIIGVFLVVGFSTIAVR